MRDSIDRRQFIGLTAAAAMAEARTGRSSGARNSTHAGSDGGRVVAGPARGKPFLTGARDFVDVSRGNPKPYTLKGVALARARLTPRTWRLEIMSDGSSKIARPSRLEDGT